jgi:hypothetical protein
VQALPSLHVATVLVWTHEPAVQPSVVHWLASSHGLAVPAHWPAVQRSSIEQAFASSQAVPSGRGGHTPVAGLQVPATWHWLEALQTTGLPPTHVPVWHWSVRVQALASLQAVPFVATVQAAVQQLPPSHGSLPCRSRCRRRTPRYRPRLRAGSAGSTIRDRRDRTQRSRSGSRSCSRR